MNTFWSALAARKLNWVVTGSAGFIGSHLLEILLRHNQHVVSVDNFATGKLDNLREIEASVGEEAWKRHGFIHGDIADPNTCRLACRAADVVLHQAALGSVPRSIADPLLTHQANVNGFVNMLEAARAAKARFVYASSSATYGDHPGLPKAENAIGDALSPYGVSKRVNELYAAVFARCYGMQTVGMRYFNVFGPRQDPDGPYAAVIPRWIRALLRGEAVEINGDGETTRDFCFVANVVQANLLAALTDDSKALNRVYNIAVGERISLNRLLEVLRDRVAELDGERAASSPRYRPFREGDVKHSLADISLARKYLGYEPSHDVARGLTGTLSWYVSRFSRTPAALA